MKIGILGGIGPQATGLFYLKLIERFQKEKLIKKNQDFPQILINSVPAPELIFDEIKKNDLDLYLAGLKELDQFNPDFIIMVCNTIHLYHEKLQSEIKSALIDLRKEVHEKIKSLNIKSMTIFGTPSTINLGLYNFTGIKYINPNKEDIRELSKAVFLFNKGFEKENQKRKVEIIARKYLSAGSERILIGCTEFAVMLENSQISKLDTIDVLVDCVVEKYKKKMNKS